MLKGLVSLTGVAMTVAGCALFPSDPQSAPVGLRRDSGTISVFVPDCPGDEVTAAQVTPMSPDRELPASWIGSGFTGKRNDGISFGSSDWSKVTGDYHLLTSFFVTVETRRRYYGELVESSTLVRADSLSAGQVLVGKTSMTATKYREMAKKFPC